MSTANDLIPRLLEQVGLAQASEPLAGGMYKIKWGSATLVTSTSGGSVIAVAPLFTAPPESHREQFYRRLLELNATLGGTASFAVHSDGTVVLQTGRGTEGLSADEFALMLGAVGKFADEYDDKLRSEFYA